MYADRAAKAALNVFAWEEALEMLMRARECSEALERREEVVRLDEAMGDAAISFGDFPAATEHHERAIAGADGNPDVQNRIRGKVAEAYVISGDPRGEEHALLALKELDPQRLPQETAQAMMIAARYRHLRGELEQAAAIYRQAVALAEPLADWDFLCRLYSFLAPAPTSTSPTSTCRTRRPSAAWIGETKNKPTGVMLGCEFLAENSYYRGWWHRHLAFNEREEALAPGSHAGERYGWTRFRAFSLHALGRLEVAATVCRRGIEYCERTGDRRLELFLRGCYALCSPTSADSTTARSRRPGRSSRRTSAISSGIRSLCESTWSTSCCARAASRRRLGPMGGRAAVEGAAAR